MQAHRALAGSPAEGGIVASKELVEAARGFAAAAKSRRTKTEYVRDWSGFQEWCQAHRVDPLPASAQVVALYLADRAEQGRAVATIGRNLAAISEAHKAEGLPSPRGFAEVRATMKGIRRRLGCAQRQARPLLPNDLRAIVAALPSGTLGTRDRALLLLGFVTAMRRAELVALETADLVFCEEGLVVNLRKSKTDPEARGRLIGVPLGRLSETCPVRAVKEWLRAAGINDGPVFREVTRHGWVATAALSARSVARVVKRSVALVGIDPEFFSGHSLRAGLVTAAVRANKSLASIQKTTGHKSTAMLMRYVRENDLFRENAADGLL